MKTSGYENLEFSDSIADIIDIVNGFFNRGQCCYFCVRIQIMPGTCQFLLQREAVQDIRIRVLVDEVFYYSKHLAFHRSTVDKLYIPTLYDCPLWVIFVQNKA